MQTNLERVALFKHRAINALAAHVPLSGAMDELFEEAESNARVMDEYLEQLGCGVAELEITEPRAVIQ